jgi:hypothetical protein
MITLDRCLRLLESGLSLATLSENKQANFSWKPNQTMALPKEEFAKRYNYNGGIMLKSGEQMKATTNIALITGYNNIEVIDVDLKVFPTLPEQDNFWNELHNYLKSNIDDFDLKFVIYKTKNQGYHILYKCKTIVGNSKIAKLKGHKECVIESRGIGGYVVVYDNQISKLDYLEIKEITERDRQILWDICKTYHYVDVNEMVQPDKKEVKEYAETEISPWVDYNNKTDIFDVIGSDFKIVKKLANHYIILRHGATSVQSGYVYRNSNCMYLFSTGTIYPNEKLISPFSAYAIKNHNGNYKEAAKDLYNQGFGSRIVTKKKPIEDKEVIKINVDELNFPIDIFPQDIQDYMIECNKTLDSSIDYMGCSMLWLLSVIVGNSIQIEVKRGWYETCNVWIAIVGKAGLGKTPSISNIIYPLQKINSKRIKEYIKQYDKYEAYSKLTAEEQKQKEETKKPIKNQFIANDITLEALVDLHQESKNAVGVFKDELAGWFKDMNKYRAGSDLEFWLSSWSGKSVSMNRKTAKSSFVEKPFIPVLGGIQPGILEQSYTAENKENGFIDRMLVSMPELDIESYNTNEMNEATLEWYETFIIGIYEHVKFTLIEYDQDAEILVKNAKMDAKAKIEWQRIFNDITNVQNSDDENEYMKSMLPKQKSYIPRFALLIHILDYFMDVKHKDPYIVNKDAILKAEKLSKYFIQMAKKVKVNSIEHKEIKDVIYNAKNKTNKEKFIDMYTSNPELDKKKIAEILGVSLQMIYKYMKEPF